MFEHLKGTCLYYPCSGEDWLEPIQRFLPYLKEFWFVDPIYFPAHAGAVSRDQHSSIPRTRQLPPKLSRSDEFEHLDTTIEGDINAPHKTKIDPKNGRKYLDYTPCIVTERYREVKTGEEFIIHWHREDGRAGLKDVKSPLGVFFHRGDGGPGKGEGASGAHWLSKKWLTPVLEMLVDGGLIVTDGSCGKDVS